MAQGVEPCLAIARSSTAKKEKRSWFTCNNGSFFFEQRSVPPLSSPVCFASFGTASWCSPIRVKRCAPTCAAPLTGTTKPRMKATHSMTAPATVTWTAAYLSPAMRPASAWSWPWRSQKSVTANMMEGPRFPCAQMRGLYTILGSSRPFFLLHLSGKASIVNSMVLFQIPQPHGLLKNTILDHTWWMNHKYS
jgi:hypothetical protein